MSARIILETHGGTRSRWYSVDLVAGDDSVALGASIGRRDHAEDVANRWAAHLGIEVEERDWADVAKDSSS